MISIFLRRRILHPSHRWQSWQEGSKVTLYQCPTQMTRWRICLVNGQKYRKYCLTLQHPLHALLFNSVFLTASTTFVWSQMLFVLLVLLLQLPFRRPPCSLKLQKPKDDNEESDVRHFCFLFCLQVLQKLTAGTPKKAKSWKNFFSVHFHQCVFAHFTHQNHNIGHREHHYTQRVKVAVSRLLWL